jgi:hypothetical protein
MVVPPTFGHLSGRCIRYRASSNPQLAASRGAKCRFRRTQALTTRSRIHASSNAWISAVEGIIEVPREDTHDDNAMPDFRVLERAIGGWPERDRSAARAAPSGGAGGIRIGRPGLAQPSSARSLASSRARYHPPISPPLGSRRPLDFGPCALLDNPEREREP